MRTRLAVAAFCLLAASGCGGGGDLSSAVPPGLHGLPGAKQVINYHPFSAPAAAFAAYLHGTVPFEDAVRGAVAERVGAGVHVDVVEEALPELIRAGGKRYNVRLSINGVPLYGVHAAASRLADGQPVLHGTLPALLTRTDAAADAWPDLEDTQQRIVTGWRWDDAGAVQPLKLSGATRYYYPTASGQAAPVWRMLAVVGGAPYEVLADADGIKEAHPFFLDASTTATAVIDAQTVDDQELVRYPLKDLSTDGTLTSSLLTTVLPDGYVRAVAQDGVFSFPESDARFAETAAYAHTDDHIRWLLGKGAQTYGSLPLQVEMHQLFSDCAGCPVDDPNNAKFVPGDKEFGTPFKIQFGDGDGRVLQNLATDRDVPAHESGHYVVYKYLTHLADESIVLHEALADILVFAQQGDACLGHSICPETSSLCVVEAKCLRTADNAYKYGDADWVRWQNQPHMQSMVLSGLLWDLEKNGSLSNDQLASLVLKTITYFKQDAGIADFLVDLLIADQELYQCKYASALQTAMQARNLWPLISSTIAAKGSCLSLADVSPPPQAKAKSRSGMLSCGVIGGAGPDFFRVTPWLVLLGLPLALALPGSWRRRRPAS